MFPTSRIPRQALALSVALAFGAGAQAAPVRPKDAALYEHAVAARPAVLQMLERLVNIDSGTGNEKGLNAVGAIVAEELKKMGMRVELLSAAPAAGSNIVATLTGKGKARILLMAHSDTVFADGTAAARPFRIEGTRAYGPGIVDDKAGVVAAVHAIKLLQKMQFTDFGQLTLLINTNEETFSKGTMDLINKLAREHETTLSLESGRPADGVVVWRKGSADLLIEVKGKAAHAGVAPESGRNAAMEAAHQMLQMASLGNAGKATTVNFTVVKSGDRRNVIPNAAIVEGDMRALDMAEYERVEKEMARLSGNRLIAGTEVKTTLTRGMVPMPVKPATDALAAQAQAIYGELGMKLTLEGSGGAADANFTSNMGSHTIDGLGLVGGNIHTENEYLELNSIAPRLYLLTRLIMVRAAGK